MMSLLLGCWRLVPLRGYWRKGCLARAGSIGELRRESGIMRSAE